MISIYQYFKNRSINIPSQLHISSIVWLGTISLEFSCKNVGCGTISYLVWLWVDIIPYDTPLRPTLDTLITKSTQDITKNFESTPDTPTPLHGPYMIDGAL